MALESIYSMLKLFFAAALLAGFIMGGDSSLASETLQTTTFQRAYDSQCAALLQNDFTAAANIFGPQFSAIDVDNRTGTRDEVIGRLNLLSSQYRIQNCVTRIVSVKENSGNYTVTAEQTFIAETNFLPRQIVQMVLLQGDTWQQMGNAWKIAARATAERSVSVNGSVVTHEVRPYRP